MRNEIITKINDLFDENANLKVRNAFLEAKENERNEVCCSEKQGKTKLDIKIIEYGKRALAKAVLSTWRNEGTVYKDENGEFVFTNYDKWFKDKIVTSEVPNNISMEELKNLIYPYAIEQYEKEKAESMKDLEERELKEGKEDE
ncbi:MAG: hypothetical protein K2M17_00515 [Bacilli bacterium]|nr:hypothetical protein [Bacilli bacterium]